MKLKVFAINSSPNMDKGSTAFILNPFIEGMREAGADVEVFYTKKLKINPCQGEFNCWKIHPGECFQKDDMTNILPVLAESEIWVLASPLYMHGVNGPMKNFLDRIIPLMLPFAEIKDGHIIHHMRENVKLQKIVLVASCGFWKLDHLDPLVEYIKGVCDETKSEFAGALLRPHAHALESVISAGMPIDFLINAAKEAGKQLITNGHMSSETLELISKVLLPQQAHMEGARQVFKY